MTDIHVVQTQSGALFLMVGTTLKVRFGSIGSQVAVVTKITSAGNIYARKFSKNRNRWSTTDVRIYPADIIGLGE